VDEERAKFFRFIGEDSRCIAVDAHGEGGFGFSAINGRVGGGVQNYIGTRFADGRANLVCVAEVAGCPRVRDDLARVLKCALQFYS
jgi:hypothetical protein